MKITELYIFPVKGIGGQQCSSRPLFLHGFEHDRRWMLHDADGNSMNAKRYPALRKIQVDVQQTSGFVFSAASMPTIIVYDDYVAIDTWLTSFLGTECHLIDVEQHRDEHGGRISFSHGYPVLLQSQGSLDDINSRLERPVVMERFRPNLVVDECQPYEEDQWRHIRIGDIEFDFTETCIRCPATTIDPVTAKKSEDEEPYRTLRSYRSNERDEVMLGIYLTPRSAGTISVGDPVVVLEKSS